jgi:SOS-response transcriptional repressor LexA
MPLTPRQAEILEAIRSHIEEHHRPPSQPELARALGLASTNGVFKHLDRKSVV